jgi:hypothetical protein
MSGITSSWRLQRENKTKKWREKDGRELTCEALGAFVVVERNSHTGHSAARTAKRRESANEDWYRNIPKRQN